MSAHFLYTVGEGNNQLTVQLDHEPGDHAVVSIEESNEGSESGRVSFLAEDLDDLIAALLKLKAAGAR
jgi:hypothetical protein